MEQITCHVCQRIHFVNTAPGVTLHIQCPYCNTYLGKLETDWSGNTQYGMTYLGYAQQLQERANVADSAAERLRQISERNKARRNAAKTGPTVKLTAKYCRHCGEPIPEMLDDNTMQWCSFCGENVKR